MSEGIILAINQDNRFKSEPDKRKVELAQVHLLSFAGGSGCAGKSQSHLRRRDFGP